MTHIPYTGTGNPTYRNGLTMAKREKQCKIKGCNLDVYADGFCRRHRKTEDRVQDSDTPKAQGVKGDGKKKPDPVVKYPAGVQAADVNPAREDSVAPDSPLDPEDVD